MIRYDDIVYIEYMEMHVFPRFRVEVSLFILAELFMKYLNEGLAPFLWEKKKQCYNIFNGLQIVVGCVLPYIRERHLPSDK